MSNVPEPASLARGFKKPKQLDIEKALGKLDDHHTTSIFTKEFCDTFGSLPLPKKPSDWLAQNAEKGQTYMEFLQLSRTLHTPSSSHRRTIYLILFGEVDNTIFDIDSLINYTQRFFQMPVKLINPPMHVRWNDEKNQWTCAMALSNGKNRDFNLRTRYNERTKHSQISVTGILNLLKKIVPSDARCLIALTMYDLYGDDPDLFIAGFAMGNCRVAAFSLYRYDPYLTFNGSDWFDCEVKKPTESKIEIGRRQRLLLLRACRLLTHEICHLLGIAHCIFYSCLINGSGDLDEDFGQPLLECPIDLRKLHTLINFDIHKRYEQLLEFFKAHQFLDELKLVEIKLNVLKHSMQPSSSGSTGDLTSIDTSTSAKIIQRKRTLRSTTGKGVLATEFGLREDEAVSQASAKHSKRH